MHSSGSIRDVESLLTKVREHGIRIETNVPLAPYTTFNIGGNAFAMAFPIDTGDAADTIKIATRLRIPYAVIGAGSNILVSDKGYSGIVISTTEIDTIGFDGEIITCGSGVLLPKLAELAAERELSGLEEICDVPGTLGGGIYMNAGCSGVNISDYLVDLSWVTNDGTVVTKPRSEIAFSYRKSEFSRTDNLITEVTLVLRKGKSKEEIRERMNEIKAERLGKFPLDYPNCGSVFKRVDPDIAKPWVNKDGNSAYSAGYYIERAGLKGMRIGNAMISEKHANFIVNLGGAKASDVEALIDEAGLIVFGKFGIDLTTEVEYLGNF